MIAKKITDITIKDIQGLVDNNVLERKTLEYKMKLPDNSDKGKKEFLADISSFANTEGGDIIFGIKESNGTIESISPIEVTDIDTEVSRLESMIRSGIDPRIDAEIRIIEVDSKSCIFLIRVKASLITPHRVVYKSHDKFYRRNSNGKYPMDVVELRTSFTKSSELTERISNFRKERILDIKAGESPIPLTSQQTFVCVHIVPLSSFTTVQNIDAKTLKSLGNGGNSDHFQPLVTGGGWSYRINLNGVVAYTGGNPKESVSSYNQLYRNGIVEGLECVYLNSPNSKGDNYLPMTAIEYRIISFVKKQLKLLSEFDISSPYFVFASLVGVRGYAIPANQLSFDETYPMDVDDLLLPEVVIPDDEIDIAPLFQPAFDIVWNASGFSASPNFNENGEYTTNSGM